MKPFSFVTFFAAIWGSDEQAEEEARKKKIMDDNNKNVMLLMLNGGQTQNISSGNGTKGNLQQQVWGQPLPSPTELSPGSISKIWMKDYDNDNNNNEKQMRDMKIGDDDDMVVEDLLTSVKTHFKPIQKAEEPCFGLCEL